MPREAAGCSVCAASSERSPPSVSLHAGTHDVTGIETPDWGGLVSDEHPLTLVGESLAAVLICSGGGPGIAFDDMPTQVANLTFRGCDTALSMVRHLGV